MNRNRLIAAVAGAAALAGAVAMLRSDVQPPARPVQGPDGQQITAYNDARLVTPPQRGGDRPQQPGRLHVDARRGGALVSWPPAPYGFEFRWGRAGEQPRNVRYVATPAASLRDVPPGRYRVEVRSVDELGRRSEPTGADVDVSDREPQWQRGLGFVEDFGSGADLRADRWRLIPGVHGCPRREEGSGSIVLDASCSGPLRPISPLVLSEPDADGVRGRVVVLADSPPPMPQPEEGASRAPEPEPPPDQPGRDFGTVNELFIGLAPSTARDPFGDVLLRAGAGGAVLHLASGGPGRAPVEHRLDATGTGSPGTLRRWELVFTSDRVRVRLDGEQIGSVEYRPPWRQAHLSVSAFIVGDSSARAVARVGLVGLTGPVPDGRVVEQRPLLQASDQSAAEHQLSIAAAPAAQAARLNGRVLSTGPDGRLVPAPEVLAEVGGKPQPLQRLPATNQLDPADLSYAFTMEIPVQALASGTTVTLRSVDGSAFYAVNVELELEHRPGTWLPVQEPQVYRPHPMSTAAPRLVVRHGQDIASSGRPVQRGRLDIEVLFDALPYQAATGELAGFVALRVMLDGRPIMDFPTATDGPAVIGSYRFTLNTEGLPAAADHALMVSLIPEKPNVASPTGQFTLLLGG